MTDKKNEDSQKAKSNTSHTPCSDAVSDFVAFGAENYLECLKSRIRKEILNKHEKELNMLDEKQKHTRLNEIEGEIIEQIEKEKKNVKWSFF